MISNCINHIVFVIDASSSMAGLSFQIVKVFDNQVNHLARRSKELDQETRVSVYLFGDQVQCLIYDKDVLRLPSLASYYRAGGNTALIDGTMQSIEDLEKTATIYGSHAFLIYVLTDGQENASRNHTASSLSKKLNALPENWTVAAFVPDQTGVFEAKRFGFPANNISVWNTTSDNAIEAAGAVMQRSTEAFMRARSTGVRGTKNLFNLDVSKIDSKTVASKLEELSPNDYMILPVAKKVAIKDFVESWTKESYRQGSAYYNFNKPEKVQGHKQICIQKKSNGKVYTGAAARKLLGLPDYEVKIEPAAHPEWSFFIQSTSTNRNLIPGTNLLVLK